MAQESEDQPVVGEQNISEALLTKAMDDQALFAQMMGGLRVRLVEAGFGDELAQRISAAIVLNSVGIDMLFSLGGGDCE